MPVVVTSFSNMTEHVIQRYLKTVIIEILNDQVLKFQNSYFKEHP